MTEDDVRKALVYAGKLADGWFLQRVAEHYIELTRDGVEPAEIRDRLLSYFGTLHSERARILADMEATIRNLRPRHYTLQ